MKTVKQQTPFERLSAIAAKYSTDKKDHGYIAPYAAYLPETCRSMLEIGVATGQSALMWFEYFGKDLDLHLMDLFQNPDFVSLRWCRERHFQPYECDQTDISLMSKLVTTNFEVIIEDASHNSHAQLITFKHLFMNNLKSKGLYVCEDTHCCLNPFYWYGGEVKSFDDTILAMFHNLRKTGKIVNPYFNEGESAAFKNLIDKFEIVDDKIIFIWKK